MERESCGAGNNLGMIASGGRLCVCVWNNDPSSSERPSRGYSLAMFHPRTFGRTSVQGVPNIMLIPRV